MIQNQSGLQVDKEHYNFLSYMDKERWSSVYCQIQEILNFSSNEILEIGVGTGVLGLILKNQLLNYASIDIDPELKPTYVGSVLEMPFNDEQFDVIGCFQVLEHLPYEFFRKALAEIFRVAKKGVVLSLPNAKPAWSVSIPIPKIGYFKRVINRPFWSPEELVFNGEHYWEINAKRYLFDCVLNDILQESNNRGFLLKKEYRVWDKPYHHFFVFAKQ